MTTIAERVAAGRARRATARALRRKGLSWRDIGAAMGCSYQRASQLGRPLRRRKPEPVERWTGTISEWLAMRLARIDETLAAVTR